MSPLLSSGMLAATMFLGQASSPPTVAPASGGKVVITSSVPAPPTIQQVQTQTVVGAPMPAPQPSRSIFSWFSREDRPIMSKIQGWFKREPQEPQSGPYIQPRGGVFRETVAPPITTPTPLPMTPPSSTDFPRKLPNPSSQAKTLKEALAKETPEASNVIQQTSALKNAKNPIRPQFVNKMGRDDKFEWITGQLEYENGQHVLYYAAPEVVDKYHGRIVLQPAQGELSKFQRGDLLSVRGQLAQRQTLQGLMPVYRVAQAHLIERPKS